MKLLAPRSGIDFNPTTGMWEGRIRSRLIFSLARHTRLRRADMGSVLAVWSRYGRPAALLHFQEFLRKRGPRG